jgi:hypothetical protein
MLSPQFYLEQARLLSLWARAKASTDPLLASQLAAAAEKYMAWANEAIEDFNYHQMFPDPTPVTQQQQQIQPKQDEGNFFGA